MKTIAIVATGGTIAGTGKKGKTAAYHAGEIDIDSIIETIPEINEVAHIKEYQLMNIDSNEMTHEKWLILKNNNVTNFSLIKLFTQTVMNFSQFTVTLH